jgi:hypothetical protein
MCFTLVNGKYTESKRQFSRNPQNSGESQGVKDVLSLYLLNFLTFVLFRGNMIIG